MKVLKLNGLTTRAEFLAGLEKFLEDDPEVVFRIRRSAAHTTREFAKVTGPAAEKTGPDGEKALFLPGELSGKPLPVRWSGVGAKPAAFTVLSAINDFFPLYQATRMENGIVVLDFGTSARQYERGSADNIRGRRISAGQMYKGWSGRAACPPDETCVMSNRAKKQFGIWLKAGGTEMVRGGRNLKQTGLEFDSYADGVLRFKPGSSPFSAEKLLEKAAKFDFRLEDLKKIKLGEDPVREFQWIPDGPMKLYFGRSS